MSTKSSGHVSKKEASKSKQSVNESYTDDEEENRNASFNSSDSNDSSLSPDELLKSKCLKYSGGLDLNLQVSLSEYCEYFKQIKEIISSLLFSSISNFWLVIFQEEFWHKLLLLLIHY